MNPVASPVTAIIRRVNDFIGRTIAWLTLVMVLVTVVVVIFRYVFSLGWIWLQESVTWMHALVFMLAAAYTLSRDEHVRVDIFYRDMNPKNKALVNIAGILFLLLPTTIFIFVSSLGYVGSSWAIGETSREAGGLPALYLLKTVIPVTALLLSAQGLAQLIENLLILKNGGAGDADNPHTGKHEYHSPEI